MIVPVAQHISSTYFFNILLSCARSTPHSFSLFSFTRHAGTHVQPERSLSIYILLLYPRLLIERGKLSGKLHKTVANYNRQRISPSPFRLVVSRCWWTRMSEASSKGNEREIRIVTSIRRARGRRLISHRYFKCRIIINATDPDGMISSCAEEWIQYRCLTRWCSFYPTDTIEYITSWVRVLSRSASACVRKSEENTLSLLFQLVLSSSKVFTTIGARYSGRPFINESASAATGR